MTTLSRATKKQRPRRARDFYATTDPRAVLPLVAHLGRGVRYAEPCAGGGDLIDLLHPYGWQCQWAADLKPARRLCHSTGQLIAQQDVNALPQLFADHPDLLPDVFVTNPPWLREWLHPIINTLARIRPTWLLFEASWKETGQAAPFGPWCSKVLATGRLKWIENSKHQSTDDVSWYCFHAGHNGPTEFIWPTSRDAAAQGSLF